MPPMPEDESSPVTVTVPAFVSFATSARTSLDDRVLVHRGIGRDGEGRLA